MNERRQRQRVREKEIKNERVKYIDKIRERRDRIERQN